MGHTEADRTVSESMGLRWVQMRHFPHRSLHPRYRTAPHDALIGIGGNLGNVSGRFARLFAYWSRSRRVEIVATSPILINPPFGYREQPEFYNAVVHVHTPLDPQELLRYILYTEKRFGRKRTFPNAPRTLDLDLIFYDRRRIETSRLCLPHPFWCVRDSVVMPLQKMKGTIPW